MKVKVLKIRVSDRFQNMDEAVVNDYLERYDIVNMNAKFIQDEINYWSVMIYYQDKAGKANSEKLNVASEDELSGDEKIIYNKLKDWRMEKARYAQLPAFMIFHNRHLMSIAKYHPNNLKDMAEISGLGKFKINKYGTEIMEVLENA